MGWLYKTDHDIAQLRMDGFTFNRLEPYTTWEEVFGEALRIWAIYARALEPRQVLRIAVRYINRMRVPGPAELAEYLSAPPNLPQPIPQRVREFLCRTHVDDTNRNASAVIIQALEPRVDPSQISLLLDIDAFRDGLALAPDDPTIPERFEQLRQLKNEIFFASVTDRTVEMYE